MANNGDAMSFMVNNPSSVTNIMSSITIPKVSDIELPKYIGTLSIVVAILLLFLVLTMSDWKPLSWFFTTTGTARTNIVYALLFIIGLLVLLYLLLPSFIKIAELFKPIKSLVYPILYTIALILVFNNISIDTINKYARLFTPVILILAIVAFYKGWSGNVDKGVSGIIYERVRTMMLLFCLFTVFCVLYVYDPGGYISEYFGYTLLLTILLMALSIAYLVILLSPNNAAKGSNVTADDNTLLGFMKKFKGYNFSSYAGMGLILFIIVITIVISTYPGGFFTGFFTSNNKAYIAMLLILLICLIWSAMLGVSMFPEMTGQAIDTTATDYKINFAKRVLMSLFGVIISGLIIGWIVYNINSLTGKTGTESFILNSLLVIVVLGLIYKTLYAKKPVDTSGNKHAKNYFIPLLINILFYIPCLFSELFDTTEYGSFVMLILAIVLLLLYFKGPSVFNSINLQGGKQLVNKPVNLNSAYSLGTYQTLNGSDKFNYQYAISFWVFLESAGPNTNSAYNKYTSLLNFGNKPNVLYNGETNTLMVTIHQKNLKNVTKNKLTDFDDNGNRVLYKGKNFPLQKWNNIIINYNGGVLDIFINGEIVKSDIGVVPYYTLDNLSIGEDNGINGGVCNVVYFNHAITTSNIYYLYNMVKDKTPPVLNDSNETIMKENVNTVVDSLATSN